MSLDQLTVDAQIEFLKKYRGENELAELEVEKGCYFKDETRSGLFGSYHVGMFMRGVTTHTGIGRIVYDDFSLYEGMIVDGKSSGFGRLFRPTGECITGYFKDGELNGFAHSDLKGADYYIDGTSKTVLDRLEAAKAPKAP